MEWVKLSTTYPDDVAIAAADDAGEVMFTRGLAYCGRAKTGGFIPDSKLQDLCRRPSRAKVIVRQMTRDTPLGDPGPWEKVAGGYRVRNWEHYQEQFDALASRRKSDRDRKARQRSAQRGQVTGKSRDTSRDESADVTEGEKRREDAAAAAVPDAPSGGALPPAVEILRGQLDARKLTVRWDTLSASELAEVERLVVEHGDTALVKSALASYQPAKPPATAKAWLGQWRDLRAPGDLALVAADPCPQPGHSGTTRHCTQCASEQKAVR